MILYILFLCLRMCREINAAIPDDVFHPLIDDGYIDSFGCFMLAVRIEDFFNIQICDRDLIYENFCCIKSICSLIESRRSEKC